jgi:hypothetical protein
MNSAGLDSLISNVVDLSGPEKWDVGVGCADEDQEFGVGPFVTCGTNEDCTDRVRTKCGVLASQCPPEAAAMEIKAEVRVKHIRLP